MPRLARRMARTAVVAGTATAVSGNVSRRQQARHAPAEQTVAEQPVVPVNNTNDQMAQLEKLGQLKEQGILTEEEFAAKKAEILGL